MVFMQNGQVKILSGFVRNEILNYFLVWSVIKKFVVRKHRILDYVTASQIQPRPEDESTKCFWP